MTPEMLNQFNELMNESMKMTKEEFDSIQLDEEIVKEFKEKYGIEIPTNTEYKFENKEDEERYNLLFSKPLSLSIEDFKNKLGEDIKDFPDAYAKYFMQNKKVLHRFEDLLNDLEDLNSNTWKDGMMININNQPLQPIRFDDNSIKEGRETVKKLKGVINKTPNPATITQFLSQYNNYDKSKVNVEEFEDSSITLKDLTESWEGVSKMGTPNPNYNPKKPTIIKPKDPKLKRNTNMRVKTYNCQDLSDQENVAKSIELEKEIDEGYGTDFDENIQHPDEFFQEPYIPSKEEEEFLNQDKKKPKPQRDPSKKRKRFGKKK